MTPGYEQILNYYLNNQSSPTIQVPYAPAGVGQQCIDSASIWQNNSYLPYTGNSIYSYSPATTTSSSKKSNTDSDKELTYDESLAKTKAEEKEKKKAAPLTLEEKAMAKMTILKQKAKESVEEHGGIGGAMIGAAAFSTPAIYKAATTDSKVIEMCIKGNPALYKSHPDLMIEAQEALRKIQRNYASDIKRATGNKKLIKELNKEQAKIFNNMQQAIRHGHVVEIAKLTSECNAASGVKNGFLARTLRGWKGEEKLLSRSKHVADQQAAGKIKYQSPKPGSSLWKNIGGKSAGIGSLLFIGINFFMDRDKIKEAYSIDTSTGNKQLFQTGVKGLSSAAFWTLGEAAGKTIAKQFLGKIAARAATKIATKGAGKLLGAAIGSFIPGLGTVAGLLLGTVADFLISKYVIPKIFPNNAVDVAKVDKETDKELISELSNSYMMGNDIGSSYQLLEAKLDEKDLKDLKTLHNMSEKEREAVLAQAAQQQSQTYPA